MSSHSTTHTHVWCKKQTNHLSHCGFFFYDLDIADIKLAHKQHTARHKRGVQTPLVPRKRMKTLKSVTPLQTTTKSEVVMTAKRSLGWGGGEGALRIPVKQEEDWR